MGCVTAFNPACARTRYESNWSVLIVTQRGACEPAFRYGVQIVNGAVSSDTEGVATEDEFLWAVRVVVRAGNEWTDGSGRLSGNRCGGVWRGEGASGDCDGIWTAERIRQLRWRNGRAENDGRRVIKKRPSRAAGAALFQYSSGRFPRATGAVGAGDHFLRNALYGSARRGWPSTVLAVNVGDAAIPMMSIYCSSGRIVGAGSFCRLPSSP